MRNRLVKTTLSHLMSVLVLAWGTTSPGVAHCHAGGRDAAHRHDHAQSPDHDGPNEPAEADHRRPDGDHHSDGDHADGDHAHGDHGNSSRRASASALIDSVTHFHVCWLGMEFSIPMSGEPDEREDKGGSARAAVASAMHETLIVAPARSPVTPVFLADACVGNSVTVSPGRRIMRPFVITSAPLCDSARFERTGVLRI